jgi:hypothetical protein
MTAKRVSTPAERMKRYRARKQAAGFRQVQIWLPDTHSAAFRRELRRQARRIAASESEKETLAFMEAVADWPDR